MSYEAQGALAEIFDEAQVSDRFKKREFVLEIPDGAYTNHIKFQLTQDKCSILDQYAAGQEVKVSFNLSGKPFTKDGKTLYFTNLQAWRIEPVNGAAKQPVTESAKFVMEDTDPDLPF